MDERQRVVIRLKKVEGQVAGVSRMYASGRDCTDTLDQLAAVRAGLEAAALLILEDHVTRCLQEAIANGGGEVETARLMSAVWRFMKNV